MKGIYPVRPAGRKTATRESGTVAPSDRCSMCVAAIADRLLGGIERATHRLSGIEAALEVLNATVSDAASAAIPGFADERERRLEAAELARRESGRWAS